MLASDAADFEAAAVLMTREHGKPHPEAEGELDTVASVFRYYAEMVATQPACRLILPAVSP